MTSDYKKYSLEKLQEWVHDAMNSDASPHEIYSAIREAVREDYYYHKDCISRAGELLALLNDNGESHLSCDKDDKSPECQQAWNSFWEEHYYQEEYAESTNSIVDLQKEIEEIREEGGYDWTPEPSTKSSADEFKSQNGVTYTEYVKAKIEANSSWNDGWTQAHYQKIVDKYEGKQPKKWVLPVEETKDADTDETEYFVSFPDDLLEAADLKEGDQVEWVDRGDGSYLLRKI